MFGIWEATFSSDVPSRSDVEDVQQAVAANIRRRREAAVLTQEEAAHRAGIDYKRWQQLEAGTINATLRTLVRAADALGVTFWDLVASARK